MNKRKASADWNIRQKTPSRRPSTASLLAKGNNNLSGQRHSRTEKSPTTEDQHRLEEKDSSKILQANKDVSMSLPKTRFNSEDRCRESRSSSSPRLKSFPGEKIKKLKCPAPFSPSPIAALIMQQNSCESGTLFVPSANGQCQNNGQGDAVVGTPFLQKNRPEQSVHSASQQQVAPRQTVHQIGQLNPNSESRLAQQVVQSHNQVHRPFVPSVSHGTAIREYSPQKTGTVIPVITPSTTNQNPQAMEPSNFPMPETCLQQFRSNAGAIVEGGQNENQNNKIDDNTASCADYEKQPVGGRNAFLHRQTAMQRDLQRPQAQTNTFIHPNMINKINENQQHLPCSRSDTFPVYTHVPSYPNHAHPQQAYQQLQRNIAHQQQMQQRLIDHQLQMRNQQGRMQANQGIHYNYNPENGRSFVGQGMTSPQDLTTNEFKNSRMVESLQQKCPTHQRDVGHVINHQNGWPQMNPFSDHSAIKAQLKPFAVDLVNNSQPQVAIQSQQQATYPKAMPTCHQQYQFYTNPYPSNAMHPNQQHSALQNQPNFYQERNLNHQPKMKPSTAPQSAVQTKPNEKVRSLQFTREMIRDQELLVSTMRQQGVPDEIMRRQFDALLNEQRRHLLYLQEVQKQEELPDAKRVKVTARRTKHVDEKPEWMIHITPPRLSYTEMERLRSGINKEQGQAEVDQPLGHARMQDVMQQSEIRNRQVPAYPISSQNQRDYQHWQHRTVTPPSYENVYFQPYPTPVKSNMNQPLGPGHNSSVLYEENTQRLQNIPYYQYPLENSYNSPFQQYGRVHQGNQYPSGMPIRNDFNKEKNLTYEDNVRSVEPCSLLKMRVYRDVIRPQKRNNGLQDPEIAHKALECPKNSENRIGLEYLTNLTMKKSPMKLNGIQEPNEVEADLQQQPLMESALQIQKRISANGLENTRNSNNPQQRRLSCTKRSEQELIKEYPRQRQNNPRNCYSMQAERENGTVAMEQQTQLQQQTFAPEHFQSHEKLRIPYNEKNPMAARTNIMPFKFDEPGRQYYQQMQQYYQNTKNLSRNNGEGDIGFVQRDVNKRNLNSAGGDACETLPANDGQHIGQNKFEPCFERTQLMNYNQTDIHETRTIGGIKYLARKQSFIPNTHMISPETLIASRHLQPPIIL